MAEPMTTIWVSVKTRDRLIELGKKKDTFDIIINRLLDNPDKGRENNARRARISVI